ncbi:hypothetical protein [Micromonospora sp. NPDC048839]|uniref:hypothetical protein n=1 Tax=Micromonospora sp. NPDC048839 TaxID=3155641 RepID=UPI0033CFFCFB
MPHQLDLPTVDNGGIYFAAAKRYRTDFVLAVTDYDGKSAEVGLTEDELIALIHSAATLLAEARQ